MNKPLKFAVALFLLALVLVYLLREPLRELAYAQLTQDMFVTGDYDEFDPGPAVGSHFPGLQANYQGRTITLIEEFAGANGTVFIASRSFDWCPYCKRQIIQLQEIKADFDAAGISLVAITYDQPALQRAFVERHNIAIPVLSDTNGLSFKTLGILNRNYSPGDSQYGIPHPGMIVIDPHGTVVGKLFLEAYSSRVDSTAALIFAMSVLGLAPPP